MTELTVQAYIDSDWKDIADISLDSKKGWMLPARMRYRSEHIIAHFDQVNEVALSCNLPVDFMEVATPHWPCFLLDMLPQGHARRSLLSHTQPDVSVSEDWHCLIHGSANPIGNLRLTSSVVSFTEMTQHILTRFPDGVSEQDMLTQSDRFLEYLSLSNYSVAGSSGLQGECPKYLLSQDHQGRFHIDGVLPDSSIKHCYIYKQPKTRNNERDQRILFSEPAFMQLAKQMGLLTYKPIQQLGQAILIERFDRKITATGVQRLAQESLLSVMQKSGYGVSFTHQEAVEALVKHTSVPWFSVTEYFLRDVLNITLGNRDNHGRNTAIHRYGNHIGLTPLFDFAPMYLDQDAIARSATWRSFETLGLPNYPTILSELCDQYEALAQNLPLIINRLTLFVTRFSQFSEIALSCGVDPQIMRERASYIVQINALMRETLSVLANKE